MRSASSLAFFSASSKSMMSAVTFLAPSFGAFFAPSTLAFRGPAVPVFRRAAEDVMRLVVGFFSSVDSVLASGDEERLISFPLLPAVRKGEGVRPAGVAVLETGGVGRFIAGLSQEEKKSSSGSPAGVAAPSSVPSRTTSPGYLSNHMSGMEGIIAGLLTPGHPWQHAS